jgi:hypothetical protein
MTNRRAAKKAARTRKLTVGKKAARTRRLRAAGTKAALTRKRRAAARKAAATRTLKKQQSSPVTAVAEQPSPETQPTAGQDAIQQ